jgi:hypothetical protein
MTKPRISSHRDISLLTLAVFSAAAFGLSTSAYTDDDAPPRPGSGAVVLLPDPPSDAPVRDDLDAYGGWLKLKGEATGFFHTEQLGGRWWLVTPAGYAFFGLGVRKVPQDGSADRFRAWGMNCAYTGGERPPTADDNFPYMLNLRFIRQAPRKLPVTRRAGLPPWLNYYDVFDPEWVTKCEEYAESHLKPHANDPLMVGYWIDNEPSFEGWYEAATHTDTDAPARKAFVEIARAYYAAQPDELVKDWAAYNVKSIEDLYKVQGDPPSIPKLSEAWQVAIAEETFSTIRRITREVDPNHLNLGVRMMSSAPPLPGVLAAMGENVDVVSMNLYSVPADRLLTQIFTVVPIMHQLTGKPIMTSEFSYRGGDTLCPNTVGAPPTVPTQTDRGIGYLSYVSAAASLPFFVGVNWYTYNDDDPLRAWHEYAEDCNFGIVDAQERPYAALVESMRLTNSAIYELAANPKPREDCPLFYNTQLMRWDKDWDAKFLQRFAGFKQPLADPLADMLPEPRRFHATYWIHHESPSLVVNDLDFVGDCQANMIQQLDDGHRLCLFGMRYFTSFRRALWFGEGCTDPDEILRLESNAQVLVRDVAADGRVRSMRVIDGSFARLNASTVAFRTDCKVAYLDVQFDHEARQVQIVTRGPVNTLGLHGIEGWGAVWNGSAAKPSSFPPPEGVMVFDCPET